MWCIIAHQVSYCNCELPYNLHKPIWVWPMQVHSDILFFFFDNPISFIHATTNTPYLWKPQDILHTFCPSFGVVGTLESSQVTCMMMIFVCHVESCQLGYSQTIHSSKELSVYKTSASPTHCFQKQLDLIRTLPWSWRYGAIINRLKFFQNRPYTPPFFWLQDCTLILPHSFALLVRL